jgi:hypothetical protein
MNTWPAQAEEAVRKQAEERRRAAEAEAEAERAKAAESRARADAELEEQRQREMQALQTDAMDLAGPQVRPCILKHCCCRSWHIAGRAVSMHDGVSHRGACSRLPCAKCHPIILLPTG